jgi:NADPH-dependent curcumin reductase CurA
VGQIARIKGCRVIGVAGGAEKGRWLVEELGFDAALDYKAGGLRQQMKEAVPEGIDVYFDNTGGEIFETCLFAMKNFGRIACCGAVSQYDGAPPQHGPRGIPGLIVTKRLTLRGFVVMDFDDQREKALADLHGWVASGQLKVQEDIIEGLENTPAALIGLLAGENRGKRMIRV